MCIGTSPNTETSAQRTRIALGRLLVAVSVALAWFGSSAAFAQEKGTEPDPFAGVEEMIVTGSSAVEILVPPSTAAITFDSKALQDIGVQDVGDIAAYVPNLEVATVNATNASFFIRGVGLQDFGANASSSVPIYQDGIPRNASATQLVGLFDIANVSVLKGPQGSGNLRNASAGAFVIATGAPEPERSGLATVTISKITSVDARDANRYGFETYLNTPIVDDVVMARISARYKNENPFWENRCANRIPLADRPIQNPQRNPSVGLCGDIVPAFSPSTVTPFLHRYIGEVDDYAVRGQIRIKPPDTPIDWTLRVEISNLNRDSTAGQAIGTGAGLGTADSAGYRDVDVSNRENSLIGKFRAANPALSLQQAQLLARGRLAKELRKVPLDRGPYAGALDFPGRTLLETHTASSTAVISTDAAVTTVNFGFVDYRKSEQRDTDLTPNEKFASISNDQGWELYGDASVKSDTLGSLPIGWETGAYGMYEKIESFTQQDLGRFDNQGIRNLTGFEQEIFSGGIYGQASYEFLEAFTLSAGIRYNWERKDFDVRNDEVRKFPIFFPPPPREVKVVRPNGSRNQRTWDAISGFVNLEYTFTEDVKSYMKYSRGFKAGHFNPSDAGAAKVPGEGFADPETLDSIEWGVKAAKQPYQVVQIVIGKDELLELKTGETATRIALRDLAATVKKAQERQTNSAVVISADRSVKYEVVVRVMDTLQRAGVQRVGLSVQLVN